jgi:type IV pilus assembly protein PilQ
MGIKLPVGKWLAATFVVGTAFVVGVLAASPAQAAAGSKARPAGAPRKGTTSFHFDNIPVRSPLQLIAEEGGFNLIVSDSVTGNISLRLNDVTWQQALDIVLRIKGLQQHVDGNTRSFAEK